MLRAERNLHEPQPRESLVRWEKHNPAPGNLLGETRHRGWDKELRARESLELLTQVGGSQGRQESEPGGVRAGRAGLPEAPSPTPLPPGSGISGVRAEGQLHPLLPSGSGISTSKWGVGGGERGFGLHPSWLPLDWELQLLLGPHLHPSP